MHSSEHKRSSTADMVINGSFAAALAVTIDLYSQAACGSPLPRKDTEQVPSYLYIVYIVNLHCKTGLTTLMGLDLEPFPALL